MGCDIHLTAERRVNGQWLNDDLHVEDGYIQNRPAHNDRLYSGRNYDLFAILANVRNGHGFAGVDTGDGFNPIASPRGVPDDASQLYRDWVAEWGGNGHSHSWFIVSELLAYDWTQVTTKRGVLDSLHELARWKLFGAPEAWSGSISGHNITHHVVDDAALAQLNGLVNGDWWKLFHANKEAEEKVHATFGGRPVFRVSWTTPYYRAASSFLSETMPRLWRMGQPDDVRILFFFWRCDVYATDPAFEGTIHVYPASQLRLRPTPSED